MDTNQSSCGPITGCAGGACGAPKRTAHRQPGGFGGSPTLALAVVVVRPERGTVRSLIWTSASWSVALLLGLILAWAAIATFERQDAWHGTPLQNAADLD